MCVCARLYVLVCMCTWVWLYMDMHACMERPDVNIRHPPQWISTLIFETLSWSLFIWPEYLASKPHGSSCLWLLRSGTICAHPVHRFLTWVLEINLKSLCLCEKHITCWLNHLPISNCFKIFWGHDPSYILLEGHPHPQNLEYLHLSDPCKNTEMVEFLAKD